MNVFKALLFILILNLSLVFSINASSYSFKDDSGIKEIADPAGYTSESDQKPLEEIIASNIQLVLSLVGIIFIILIIYAGINWMTASGNEEKVTKAKKIITDSIIGLIVVVVAYAVTYFILEFILQSTWDQSTLD
jgi:hypothetical protein